MRKKTNVMLFNYTDKYQFTTRLQLNEQTVDVIESTRLLGTIISNDLKWNLNTANIIKKANARMELLRKVASFGAPEDDLKNCVLPLHKKFVGAIFHSLAQFTFSRKYR